MNLIVFCIKKRKIRDGSSLNTYYQTINQLSESSPIIYPIVRIKYRKIHQIQIPSNFVSCEAANFCQIVFLFQSLFQLIKKALCYN